MENRNKERKLVIISPKLSFGGAERIVSWLSLHAPEHIAVYIILFKKSVTYPIKHPIYHIGDYNNIFEAFKVFIRFNRLLSKTRPDAILLSPTGQGLTFTLFNKCKGRFYAIHNYFFEPYMKRPHHKIFFRFLVSLATKLLIKKVIVVSYPIKYKLIKKFGLPDWKIEVIHNPVDVSLINKLASEELDEKYDYFFSNPVIINIGRMVHQKGQWYLIRLFKKVNEALPKTS